MYIDATLTSQQNVVALINEANVDKVDVTKVHVSNPRVYVPTLDEVNNTIATVAGVRGKGFSGVTDVKYRRVDIMEATYIPVRGFDVFRGMTAAMLLPIAEMTLGVPPGNISIAPFANNAPTVRISAREDSLLITGGEVFALNWI